MNIVTSEDIFEYWMKINAPMSQDMDEEEIKHTHDFAKKEWVALKNLKELIRRNKMDDEELRCNNTHSDWNKALILIEKIINSLKYYNGNE